MKKAVVIGAGAGGATIAKELQGSYQVTVLEAGREFAPFTGDLHFLASLRRTGLFFDEREIGLIYPAMRARRSGTDMVFVHGAGTGGSTTLSAGNALRMDGDLRALGIDLDDEFDEIFREIPVTTDHQRRWHPATKRLFGICGDMGLDPRPAPKMGRYELCTRCGRCIFGCPRGAKWDARQYLDAARAKGAVLVEQCRVERLEIRDGEATGVSAKVGRRRVFFDADLVMVAAGGFGTPALLENSGIPCEPHLFVDPVLCVAGVRKGISYQNEISMPFIVQQDHFIIAPYLDYLSFYFDRRWKRPLDGIVSLMVKLADTPAGRVRNGTVTKELAAIDRERLTAGLALCREILGRFGIREDEMYPGMLNAGHPGGTLPLTRKEATTLHDDRLPPNVYVADASLLPDSLGNPPILTIIALAKRIGRSCTGRI